MTAPGLTDPAAPDSVQRTADCLRAGGVVLLPTDTVFGLAASATRPEAVARIFALKARPVTRNLPIMVADPAQLEAIGARLNATARGLIASTFCPGPLSLVVGLDPARAPDWLAGRDEIAFRIPDHRFLLAVLAAAGPLRVTSANRHGAETPAHAEEVLGQLAGAPDLVIGGTPGADVPSTIVNCRHWPVVLERRGAVSEAALAPYLTGPGA